jgi:outer membrane protein assembly factor BamB
MTPCEVRNPITTKKTTVGRFNQMKLKVPLLLLASLLAGPVFAGQKIIVSGFSTPESVVHDTIADVYLVSNIGAGDNAFTTDPTADPGKLNHNGFISRVSPNGTILELKWIADDQLTGVARGVTLNGPKGIWLHGDALYVSDCDTLRLFNRYTGKPIKNIPIPNPFPAGSPEFFLNDVVVASDGTVFLSESNSGGLVKVDPKGKVTWLSTNPALDYPNGLVADDSDSVTFVTFGNEIMRLDEGKRTIVATIPAPDVSSVGLPPGTLNMDGLVRLPNGSYLATSWTTGSVYHVSKSGKLLGVVAQVQSAFADPAMIGAGPADINVDLARNRVLIPVFMRNQLVIQDLDLDD